MKRSLAITAIALVGILGFGSQAQAGDWGFRFGVGYKGRNFDVGYHHQKRHHRRYNRHGDRHGRDRYHARRVWVEPVYDRVLVGYRECGTPIYRSVLVRAGYYRLVRY